jgi:hypothetical protein
METKEIKIDIPEGYEIDKKNSTFECIKFKPIKTSKFSNYDGKFTLYGFFINNDSRIVGGEYHNYYTARNIFATEKQAKSALAMAQISQIMANDERFGGAVTDEEWQNAGMSKFIICRNQTSYQFSIFECSYEFLAFHTREQRDLFLKENEQLVKDYLMID